MAQCRVRRARIAWIANLTERSPTPVEPPLITIGITCYNAEDTIIRAVDSAIAQDWPNMEIVVVDDCSRDRSLPLIKERAGADARMRLIVHEVNKGCAAARNAIVENARGDIIAFFDDDDVSRRDRLTRQYRRIVEYERTVRAPLIACYASGGRRYPNGYEMPLTAVGSQPEAPVGRDIVDYLLFFGRKAGRFYGGGTPTCALMARKNVFDAVGPFDIALRRQEDADFAVRLGFKGGHFIGTPEPLLTQFASTGSEKSAKSEHRSFQRIIEKNREYLTGKKRYGYALGWSEVRYRHFSGQNRQMFRALLALALRHPLKTTGHLLRSAPRRFLHERKMAAVAKPSA